jgi:hypothetical protein
MLPFKEDDDYRERRNIVEEHFCTKPSFKEGTPLLIRDYEGLKELSFVFFAGWLFCGILNREKELVRPCIVPMGQRGEASLLALYRPTTHLATPARREMELQDPDFFTCPLDRAARDLTATEKHLCPVVNKLRYNLAHAKPEWDVGGLVEPAKTQECCESRKARLWEYLEKTVWGEPDVYGSIVGGAVFPVRLPFDLLRVYTTGASPRTRDFGNLLEETLLWFAMARSRILMGAPHVVFTKPFECHEIDVLLYDCAGKTKVQRDDPPEGWQNYVADQSLCLLELTIGHQPEKDGGEAAPKKLAGAVAAGKDVPKNKLVNYLALRSAGFRLVESHYVSVTGDTTMSPATKQALQATDGFVYHFLPAVVSEDIEAMILKHHDTKVPVSTVRRWHDALIGVVERVAVEFASRLAGGVFV